jgi:SAM-dependent methyltransferase
MNRFVKIFGVNSSTRILDVGITPAIWSYLAFSPQVIFSNLTVGVAEPERTVLADGRALPFRDGAFDIAFSNSVIEHVGDFEAQRRFACELRRVGKRYYVQTPDWWFLIEPHLLVPFIHWFPYWVRLRMFPFTLRAMIDRNARGDRESYARIALLSARQMHMLFPDGEIWRDRLMGLGKSLIAVRL